MSSSLENLQRTERGRLLNIHVESVSLVALLHRDQSAVWNGDMCKSPSLYIFRPDAKRERVSSSI